MATQRKKETNKKTKVLTDKQANQSFAHKMSIEK